MFQWRKGLSGGPSGASCPATNRGDAAGRRPSFASRPQKQCGGKHAHCTCRRGHAGEKKRGDNARVCAASGKRNGRTAGPGTGGRAPLGRVARFFVEGGVNPAGQRGTESAGRRSSEAPAPSVPGGPDVRAGRRFPAINGGFRRLPPATRRFATALPGVRPTVRPKACDSAGTGSGSPHPRLRLCRTARKMRVPHDSFIAP